jgi:Ca-activated chloride channel family protein
MNPSALLATLILLQSPQDLTDQPAYRFESRVDMVSVPIAVTDKKGNFVTDLGAEDFIIYEDGVEQEIALFAAGLEESWVGLPPDLKEALSGKQVIGLILDTSGSMEEEMRLVRDSALKFLNNIPKTEHLLILDFDESIRLSEYSSDDQRRIADRIYDLEPEGWTALYDAVGTFLERVYGYDGKKTLALFSDGVDSRSLLNQGECLDMVRASDVTIHTIHFSEDARRHPQRGFLQSRFLRRISDLTGGSYFAASTLASVDEFYDQIIEELFSQYNIGYVSTNSKQDGRYRKIKVEVRGDDLKWRARRGYTSPLSMDETEQP